MSRFSNLLRAAAGLGAMLSIAACGNADSKLLLPKDPPGGALMSSYVALGNSITAGWQSGGLNDSVQRNSYAFLLAQQAGTRFAYPSFTKSFKAGSLTITTGCPPLLGNWASQKLTDSLVPTPSGCALRDASKATDILNNVAVPFAYASDLLVTGAGIKIPSAAVHTFILGGKAQVDRALEAQPTFASLWIGNNETLSPASVGMIGGAPSLGAPAMVTGADFTTAVNAAVDSRGRGAPTLQGGILIGAVMVANAPRFWSADSLVIGPNAAARLTAIGTFTGKGPPAVLGCGSPGVTGWLVSSELIKAIRSGAFPANAIVCNPLATTGSAGDIFVLDPSEQATLNAATTEYNATISAKATELGWAYLDPNPILAAQRTGTNPAIPAFPNFTSNTRDAATSVFGALFSLDGVHPTAVGQKLVANAVIAAINTKYSLQIPLVP
jgi:lysophospholipase L1-like esterase